MKYCGVTTHVTPHWQSFCLMLFMSSRPLEHLMRLDLQVNKQQVMLFVDSHYRWIAKPSNDMCDTWAELFKRWIMLSTG